MVRIKLPVQFKVYQIGKGKPRTAPDNRYLEPCGLSQHGGRDMTIDGRLPGDLPPYQCPQVHGQAVKVAAVHGLAAPRRDQLSLPVQRPYTFQNREVNDTCLNGGMDDLNQIRMDQRQLL